jgi:hypothetical protein
MFVMVLSPFMQFVCCCFTMVFKIETLLSACCRVDVVFCSFLRKTLLIYFPDVGGSSILPI